MQCVCVAIQNVVVVGQPQAQPQVVSVRTRQATTFVALTAVTMVLCLLHGNLPAFVCLIPALICACVVSCCFLCSYIVNYFHELFMQLKKKDIYPILHIFIVVFPITCSVRYS